LTYLS